MRTDHHEHRLNLVVATAPHPHHDERATMPNRPLRFIRVLLVAVALCVLGNRATQAQVTSSDDRFGEEGSGPMILSLRESTRRARQRAAQHARRITRWKSIDRDTPPGRLSPGGRSRRSVRREVIQRSPAALLVASAAIAVAAAPAASAGAPSDRGGQSGPTHRPSYIFVDPGTF